MFYVWNKILYNLQGGKADKMNSGDFVYIDYIGRVKDSGEIFDLTKEDVAKKEGIYKDGIKYGPVPIIVDSNFILKGLNKVLKEMKVGEKRVVEISYEDGFGKRDTNLIKLIPENFFKEQEIDLKPGTYITIRGVRGKILSADGGRIKVDFNHPLAGKNLLYEIEIRSQITNEEEKIRAVIYYFTNLSGEEVKIKSVEGEVEVELVKHQSILHETKETIAKNVIQWVDGVKKVKFTDVYEKSK